MYGAIFSRHFHRGLPCATDGTNFNNCKLTSNCRNVWNIFSKSNPDSVEFKIVFTL